MARVCTRWPHNINDRHSLRRTLLIIFFIFGSNLNLDLDLADSSLSSTSSSDDNNDKLLELLLMAADESRSSQLSLMGDFNYPEINYNDYR